MRFRRSLFVFGLLGSAFTRLAAQQPTCTEPGKARWAIKSSVTSTYKQAAAKTVALAALIALPDAPGVTKDDARFKTTHIPGAIGAGLHEGDKVTTSGFFRLVATEANDCEYHMQLADVDGGTSVLIVEVAKSDATSIANAWLRGRADTVRTYVRTKLVAGNEPSGTGNLMQHAVYVQVTGQLFFDDFHIGSPPRGKKGMKSPTLWELHPVTAIVITKKP